jgi:hypothetical protein
MLPGLDRDNEAQRSQQLRMPITLMKRDRYIARGTWGWIHANGAWVSWMRDHPRASAAHASVRAAVKQPAISCQHRPDSVGNSKPESSHVRRGNASLSCSNHGEKRKRTGGGISHGIRFEAGSSFGPCGWNGECHAHHAGRAVVCECGTAVAGARLPAVEMPHLIDLGW